MDKKRANFTTTFRKDLLKKLKIMAIEHEMRVNDLLEEGAEYILAKYSKKKPPE